MTETSLPHWSAAGGLRRFRDAFAAGWPGPVDVLPAMKANTLLATRQLLPGEFRLQLQLAAAPGIGAGERR